MTIKSTIHTKLQYSLIWLKPFGKLHDKIDKSYLQ